MADLGVSKSELISAGNALMDIAEGGKLGSGSGKGAQGGSSALSGTTSEATGKGAVLEGFALDTALRSCESRWEDATDMLLAKISLAGDKIVLSGEAYDETERNNSKRFDFLG